MSAGWSAENNPALVAALHVCASVSEANLAKRTALKQTLVDPYALRALADAVEVLFPGAIAEVRAERQARLRALVDPDAGQP